MNRVKAKNPSVFPLEMAYRAGIMRILQNVEGRWQNVYSHENDFKWIVFSRKTYKFPDQGWKIHVSCSRKEFGFFIDKVILPLLHHASFFKLPGDLKSFYQLNSGLAGPTQIGKILTIYPAHDKELYGLIDFVCQSWKCGTGPRIKSDLALTPQGDIGIRYGSYSQKKIHVDPVGRIRYTIIDENGKAIEDNRVQSGNSFQGGQALHVQTYKESSEGVHELKSKNNTWIPLAKINASAKGNVILVLRQQSPQKLAICKTASRGVMMSIYGQEACALLRQEKNTLNQLYNKGFPVPQVLDFHTDSETSQLFCEDMVGFSLDKIAPDRSMPYISQLFRYVHDLHELGYVHRDIKPGNVLICPNGSVILIDFEIATNIGKHDGFRGGTFGYYDVSKADDTSLRRDYIALAIMFARSCMIDTPEIVSGDPGKMIGFFLRHGLKEHVVVLKKLLNKGSKYLNLYDLAGEIDKINASDFIPTQRSKVKKTRKRWLLRAVYSSCMFLDKFICRKDQGICWINSRKEGDLYSESLARGTAGVIFSLMTVSKILKREDFGDWIMQGCNWLMRRNKHILSNGFFTGNSGVAVVLLIASEYLNNQAMRNSAMDYLDVAICNACEEADLYFGKAGILWACCIFYEITKDPNDLEKGAPLAKWLHDTVKIDKGICFWENSGILAGQQLPYLGAAHGSAGIAMALAQWGRLAKDTSASHMSFNIFSSLFSFGKTQDGKNIRPQITDLKSKYAPFVWCHGVGGYLWCLLQSIRNLEFNIPGSQSFFCTVVQWAFSEIKNTSVFGNTTYCHGLSGRLDILHMLKGYTSIVSEKHLKQESEHTVSSIRNLAIRKDSNICWASEHGKMISPELWCGFLSPATILALDAYDYHHSLLSSDWFSQLANMRKVDLK